MTEIKLGPLRVVPRSLFEKATHLAALIQGMEPECRRIFCELLEIEMHPPMIVRADPKPKPKS